MILWWLLDRSPRQRATAGLVVLLRRMLPAIALALRLPRVFVRDADGLMMQALLDTGSQQRLD